MKQRLHNLLDKFGHLLKKRSLQFTLSLTFTLVAIAGMIVVTLTLSARFTKTNEKMISEDNQRVLSGINLNLDNYLHNIMRVSDSMYYRVIKSANLDTASDMDAVNKDMALFYNTYSDLLVSVSLFSDDGTVLSSEPLQQLKSNVNVKDQDWFQSAKEKIENVHFSVPHVQNLFVDSNNPYRWVVSLSRSVELTRSGSIYHGVLLVDMNFSGIEQICKNADLGESGYIYLISNDGEIIYHPRQQLIYSNLIHENNLAAATYSDGNHTEIFENEERMISVKTVGYTGWKIVGVVPIKDITANYTELQTYIWFFAFFTIFLLASANLFLSSRIANPIKELEQSVRELEKGNLSAPISIGGSYEVRHLGSALRSMAEQMRKLMDDIVAEQESKRKSEMDALQAQINPHFLYNTLDSIVWMIENEHYDGAIEMVTALAKLFRISLSKGKTVISVKDELEHVRNYLTIQKTRYKNKFIYTMEAEPEILSCATIKLIVQPLVENAIYHGMEFMDGDGEIHIRAYRKEKELFIDVVDNGPGMPPEQAQSLFLDSAQKPKTGKGSGVGLRNVNERIQLYFGKEYGLTILSQPDEGTLARIHLPVKTIAEVTGEGGDPV